MILSRRSLGLAALSGALAPAAFAQQAAPAAGPAAGMAADDRAGYLLVMGTSLKQDVMTEYGKMLPPIYDKYKGYYVAVGGVGRGVTVLEGKFDSKSVLLARFPAPDAVNEFWWSPEYRAAAKLRIDAEAGKFTVLRLKGRPGEGARAMGKPAYLIGIEQVKDPVKLREYGAKAGPLVGAHGGKIVAGGGRKDIELLEGSFGNLQSTVVRFESLDALRKFYNDPAYQDAIKLRQAAADSLVLEIDGTEFKG